jgi:hypothetical protein
MINLVRLELLSGIERFSSRFNTSAPPRKCRFSPKPERLPAEFAIFASGQEPRKWDWLEPG